MSTVEVIAIAGVLSALAYWLGHAAGHAKAIRRAVLWLRHYGVRDADFAAFMTARQPALLRTAYLLSGNRADAEDLVQTALAKLYLAWDRVHSRDSVDAYVRRILETVGTVFHPYDASVTSPSAVTRVRRTAAR